MILGLHISGTTKIYEIPEKAKELGCNTFQFFSRSPQRWRSSPLSKDDIEEFKKQLKKSGIDPVFIHISYLINLASPNQRLYQASIKAYVEDIREASLLGVNYIVTHMGSHKETSEEDGLRRLKDALNKIIDKTKGLGVKILLENTSGSGSWLGYKFSHQKYILEGVIEKERIGFCIDTAHAYLAGYDISTSIGLEALLQEVEDNIGIEKVKLIHLNDAYGILGSKHDRHNHIGKGNIGLEGIKRIVNHPKLRDMPFILETPKDSLNADKTNLRVVRKIRR